MSDEVKPGRWRQRDGNTAAVQNEEPDGQYYRFFGHNSRGWPSSWRADGFCFVERLKCQFDLVEYLGPAEHAGGES